MRIRLLHTIMLLPLLLVSQYMYGQEDTVKIQSVQNVELTDNLEDVADAPVGEELETKYWTLRECIEYAQENNIQIKSRNLDIEEAEIAKQQSLLNYIPSLNAGASSSTRFNSAVYNKGTADEFNFKNPTGISMSVSASTTIFEGFKKHHQREFASLNLEATLLSIEDLKNNIALNVAAAYLEVLFCKENVIISESQLNTINLQIENTSKLVEAGKGTQSDLLQFKAQFAEMERQHLIAQNQKLLAYFNLCQLLEIDNYIDFKISVPDNLQITTAMTLDAVSEVFEAAQSLPNIEHGKLEIDIAKKNVQIAKSGYYPSLSLSASYGSSYSDSPMQITGNPATYALPFRDQLKNNDGVSASLSLSIPIFNSFQVRNSVKTRKIAVMKAEYNLALMQKELNRSIQQAFIDAQSARDQYNSSKINVQMNEEVFRIIEQKFSVGASSPLDFSMALSDFISARSKLSRSKYEYIFKSKILDFYKGIPLDL